MKQGEHDRGSTGFGLYVHWPFCSSKCPYCDFNSHVSAKVDHSAWRRAYLQEIDRLADETGDRTVETVFFGGGTPSLMEPETVADILAAVQRRWRVANSWEVTLEANPGSVEVSRFAGFRSAGVNRVSLGVQSLDDRQLARLGRRHSAVEARAAIEIARDLFPRFSFDLIYARQDQTLAEWTAELREALTLAADHISLYQLTIEEGTAFGALHKAGKLLGLPDEDRSADMYLATQDVCSEAGLHAYEISNHAKSGAESRHNMLYWTAADFGGIGPGAHGRLTLNGKRLATESVRDPVAWLRGGESREARYPLAHDEQAKEYLIMGLRVSEGVHFARMNALAGRGPDPNTVAHLSELGLVRHDDARLWLTQQGRMVLNAVARELASAWAL